ncbi:hypothetical protein PT2222_40297 [Paraburkholderia tropica]
MRGFVFRSGGGGVRQIAFQEWRPRDFLNSTRHKTHQKFNCQRTWRHFAARGESRGIKGLRGRKVV